MSNFVKLVEELLTNRTIYVLIGPPSVGKSTWIKNTLDADDIEIISRDNIVDAVASKYKLTYDDMFSKPVHNKEIDSKLVIKRQQAVNSSKDIVVDMTNLTVASRKRALEFIKNKPFTKVAVVFNFKGKEDKIKSFSKQRSAELEKIGKKKTIGDTVFDKMFNSFQEVTPSEGFDKIIYVDGKHLE